MEKFHLPSELHHSTLQIFSFPFLSKFLNCKIREEERERNGKVVRWRIFLKLSHFPLANKRRDFLRGEKRVPHLFPFLPFSRAKMWGCRRASSETQYLFRVPCSKFPSSTLVFHSLKFERRRPTQTQGEKREGEGDSSTTQILFPLRHRCPRGRKGGRRGPPIEVGILHPHLLASPPS